MCLAEITHFFPPSHTEIVHKVATNPFSADHTGDFINPFNAERCDCNDSGLGMPTWPQSDPRAVEIPQAQFNLCVFHSCCVTWTNIQYCQVFQHSISWDEDGEGDIRRLAELECPNYLLVNRYKSRAALGWVPDSGEAEEFINPTPEFKVEKLFYRPRPIDKMGDPSDDDDANLAYEALFHLRVMMMEKAVLLWEAKQELRAKTEMAKRHIEGWEYAWVMEGWYDDEIATADSHNILHELEAGGLCVASLYKDFLENLGGVLDCLGEYPELGETWTAPGESFSISHSELELRHETPDVIMRRCRGGLLMWPEVHRWYRNLKDRVIMAAEARERYWGQRGEKRILDHDHDHDDGPPRKRQCLNIFGPSHLSHRRWV
ncbi:hypothetical protein QBC34DRAFT_471982 [Podospora aff. communis PSN243]|uniref:Uncharacterized protein n=1 Tax=Podospora aff. communis PSN243 TaxID=3040156 RepID=A0AAV9GBL5_9PEZI|nr:hypothetical protein QBC34DRAFT_471982 [Podospora aff. communis PSN243]